MTCAQSGQAEKEQPSSTSSCGHNSWWHSYRVPRTEVASQASLASAGHLGSELFSWDCLSASVQHLAGQHHSTIPTAMKCISTEVAAQSLSPSPAAQQVCRSLRPLAFLRGPTKTSPFLAFNQSLLPRGCCSVSPGTT